MWLLFAQLFTKKNLHRTHNFWMVILVMMYVCNRCILWLVFFCLLLYVVFAKIFVTTIKKENTFPPNLTYLYLVFFHNNIFRGFEFEYASLRCSLRSRSVLIFFQKTLILAFEANSALSLENETKIVKFIHSAVCPKLHYFSLFRALSRIMDILR